jgi:hypothetical protein
MSVTFNFASHKVFNACTYHGNFNIVEYICDSINNDINDGYLADIEDLDWNFIDGALPKAIVDSFNHAFSKNKIDGVQMTAVELDQPRYYNYGGDSLILEVTLTNSKFAELVELSETDEFLEYLKDHYSSYPGFVSFVPTNLEALKNSKYYYDVLFEYFLLSQESDTVKDIDDEALEYFNGNLISDVWEIQIPEGYTESQIYLNPSF